MGSVIESAADKMLDQAISQISSFSSYGELRFHNNYSINLTMRKRDVLDNSSSHIGGVSARSFKGGYFGFSSAPSVQVANVKQVIQEAELNAKIMPEKKGGTTHDLPTGDIGSGIYDYKTRMDRWKASDRIDFLNQINRHIENNYTKLINWDLSLISLALEKALVTSEGAQTYSYIPRSNIVANFSVESPDGTVELYRLLGGFGDLEDNFQDPEDFFASLDDLYREVCLKAEGIYPSAGYKDVILDSDLAGILAHEAIGHTVEADIVLAGSVAGDYLGKEVASDLFTLIDAPERGFDNGANIAIHVDDEGVACQETVIIEDGILKSFLHNKESAHHFGVEPTGNARAFTFSDEPLIRMRNTYIKPGQSKLEDMIASVDDGYYLIKSSNGQADSTSEFMFGVIQGYEIKKGKLGRALRDTTVAGIAFDMLKTITAVSDDMTWSKGGMCGKKQLIPVGMGGPAIKCKIHLGGR